MNKKTMIKNYKKILKFLVAEDIINFADMKIDLNNMTSLELVNSITNIEHYLMQYMDLQEEIFELYKDKESDSTLAYLVKQNCKVQWTKKESKLVKEFQLLNDSCQDFCIQEGIQ